jgi:hypothetical protein
VQFVDCPKNDLFTSFILISSRHVCNGVFPAQVLRNFLVAFQTFMCRCACTKLVARVALRSSVQRRMRFARGPGEICALAGAQTDNNMTQIRNAKSAVRLKGLRRESLNHVPSADSRTHSSVILFERTPHHGRVA